ncbi:hypothetical protein FZEAL_5331 [Fusarium zealandicum]|uniref:Uncharacterized protein n=1 Tax=Fusarium zealandicum TaxID=1053134 RepID=A0A8H4UKC1_9HYPO|nr:hypothetical protein FZEAL_5331 [Fusarium zealandicum]
MASASTRQFDHWYPQYGDRYSNIVRINCSDEYHNYKAGNKSAVAVNWQGGAGKYTVLTQPLVECILEHTSEFLKGCMTGAQVVLGVMPTIIALLGPSHDEIAMLSNVGRRPLLAAGIALASPSAYFGRPLEYSDPTKILSHEKNRRKQWRPRKPLAKLGVSFVEYVFVGAACCNVINNTLQVNDWAISSFASDLDFLPLLWLAIGLFLHIFSGVVFRLRLQGWRVRVKNASGDGSEAQHRDDRMLKNKYQRSARGGKSVGGLAKGFLSWVRNTWPRVQGIILLTEFTPCAADGFVVHMETFRETRSFLVATWSQSTLTIIHVVFGTLVFAGMLFVGIKDALSIICRYIAGVVVCRIILMYELAGLRESWGTLDGKDVPRFGDED